MFKILLMICVCNLDFFVSGTMQGYFKQQFPRPIAECVHDEILNQFVSFTTTFVLKNTVFWMYTSYII